MIFSITGGRKSIVLRPFPGELMDEKVGRLIPYINITIKKNLI